MLKWTMELDADEPRKFQGPPDRILGPADMGGGGGGAARQNSLWRRDRAPLAPLGPRRICILGSIPFGVGLRCPPPHGVHLYFGLGTVWGWVKGKGRPRRFRILWGTLKNKQIHIYYAYIYIYIYCVHTMNRPMKVSRPNNKYFNCATPWCS